MRYLALAPFLFASFGCSPNDTGFIEATQKGDVLNPQATREPSDADFLAKCGTPKLRDPERSIHRMPYLQATTHKATSVMYAGRALQGTSVRVTSAEGTVVKNATATVDGVEGVGSARFIARIRGLEPERVYCYSVLDAKGRSLYGPVGFRTAPKPRSGVARFVVLGDSGDGSGDQTTLAKQLGTVPYDFMLHVGDMAYSTGTLKEFDAHFFQVYQDQLQHFPVFPVPGNHEYRSGDAVAYRAVFDLPNNERWYSFDWGEVHFVALDTEQVGDEQTAWLEKDLAANDSTWTIAFLHKPPYSSGWHGSDGGVREAFSPIFAKYHVPVVLTGHDHHYERTKPQDGVVYFVTGGGGAGTYPVQPSEFSAIAEEVVQMLYITADDQTLAVHAIDASGQEFDQLVVEQ